MNRNQTIFIINDDEDALESTAALVDSMGAEIYCFDSAERFVEAYSGQRPACIVTDQRMPGMSGIELLELLRSRGITVSVVMMTAFPDTRSTVRAVRGGALTLIEKPCNSQELWNEIQEGLKQDAVNYTDEVKVSNAKTRVASLTKRERDAMMLLVKGNANKVIASRLDVSLRTIESRRASILRKLDGGSVAEVVQTWLLAGEKGVDDSSDDLEPDGTPDQK